MLSKQNDGMKTVKHILLVTVASVAVTFFAPLRAGAAEPPTRAVRLGWSGYPVFADINVIEGWGCDYEWIGNSDLTSIMDDYYGATRCTGAVMAEYNWIVKKWLTVSAGFGVNHFWKKAYGKLDNSYIRTDHATAYYLLPQARFTYFNRKYVRLYSSVGVGCVFYDTRTNGHQFSDRGYAGEHQLNLMIQPVPFGVEAGNKVYGFIETGLGSVWVGVNAGVGFRF